MYKLTATINKPDNKSGKRVRFITRSEKVTDLQRIASNLDHCESYRIDLFGETITELKPRKSMEVL